MRAERSRVCSILIDTIAMLCKNSVQFKRELKVQGLIGITVDDDEVFLVQVNESCGTVGVSGVDADKRKTDVHELKKEVHGMDGTNCYAEEHIVEAVKPEYRSGGEGNSADSSSSVFQMQGNLSATSLGFGVEHVKTEHMIQQTRRVHGYNALQSVTTTSRIITSGTSDLIGQGLGCESGAGELYGMGHESKMRHNEGLENLGADDDDDDLMVVEGDDYYDKQADDKEVGPSLSYDSGGGGESWENGSSQRGGVGGVRQNARYQGVLGRDRIGRGSSHLSAAAQNFSQQHLPLHRTRGAPPRSVQRGNTRHFSNTSVSSSRVRSTPAVSGSDPTTLVITESTHICGYANCMKRFRFKHDLLRHQTKKHGRVKRGRGGRGQPRRVDRVWNEGLNNPYYGGDEQWTGSEYEN